MIIQFPITKTMPPQVPLVKYAREESQVPRKKNPVAILKEYFKVDPLLRPSDNATQQVLCKTSGFTGFSPFVNSSLTVSQSANLGRITPGNSSSPSASFTVFWPKAPLRLITARAPQYAECEISGTLKLYAYLETLECGHQVFTQPQFDNDIRSRFVDITAKSKRRRCAECKELAAKKPVATVKTKKRGIA